MKPAFFHPEADEEFAAAVAWYAGAAPELGDRFYAAMRQLTAEIEADPQLHHPWRHGTRRHFNQTFPYALIYAERPTYLWVVAVAHFKRKPDYWVSRLN